MRRKSKSEKKGGLERRRKVDKMAIDKEYEKKKGEEACKVPRPPRPLSSTNC
jgi:hypothetical protein